MFCRVCGFRVRVWESYGISRSFGYDCGYCGTGVQSGRVQKVLYQYPGYCGTERTELTEVPATGMNVVQNSQKFFVRMWMLFRTHRSSGYG